jgi:hypothetical protein
MVASVSDEPADGNEWRAFWQTPNCNFSRPRIASLACRRWKLLTTAFLNPAISISSVRNVRFPPISTTQLPKIAQTADPREVNIGGKHRTQAISPQPDGLTAQGDAPLEQQFLDGPQ